MASLASLQTFPAFCKEIIPHDWFLGSEEEQGKKCVNSYFFFILIQVSTGTTLVAVEFADGVVIAADSKTSMGTWTANRVTDKLTPVTDSTFCCRYK